MQIHIHIFLYIHKYKCIYIHTHTHIYIYISRKGCCQVPFFPRFWEYSVSATSCSIIYVHIPVMVLLEIHTDCQTSSGKNVQRVMKIPREKEGGKTNIVCVYIYMASLRGRGGQGKEVFFFFRASPLS